MQSWIDIGSSPPEEDCAQVGRDGYWEQATKECRAYINQLRRALGKEPRGARLAIKSHEHDFGTYLSVCCYFDDSIEEAVNYAYRCEAPGPKSWDDQARVELRSSKRRTKKERR